MPISSTRAFTGLGLNAKVQHVLTIADTWKATRLTATGAEQTHTLDVRCIGYTVRVPKDQEDGTDQSAEHARIGQTANDTDDGGNYVTISAGDEFGADELEANSFRYVRHEATNVEIEVVEYLG